MLLDDEADLVIGVFVRAGGILTVKETQRLSEVAGLPQGEFGRVITLLVGRGEIIQHPPGSGKLQLKGV